jgi:hypothetical protein
MHLNNWIFFLLVLVAMLFRLLGRAANKASKGSDNTNKRSTSPPPLPRAPIESDDARIRKFLDALGQPVGSTPPPPVAHRTDIPPRPVAPIQPPSPYPRNILSRPKQQIIPSKTSRESTPVFEVQGRSAPVESQPEIKAPAKAYATPTPPAIGVARSETSIAALLRSPSGLRDAIILREIFGPPRSLQPLDLTGSA